jgi:hypothetical protein
MRQINRRETGGFFMYGLKIRMPISSRFQIEAFDKSIGLQSSQFRASMLYTIER